MPKPQVPNSRWPLWLLAMSVGYGIPVGYKTLFFLAPIPHSPGQIEFALLAIIGAAVLVIWAIVGIVVLITHPAQRTLMSFSAILFGLAVSLLVFTPSGLLRARWPDAPALSAPASPTTEK